MSQFLLAEFPAVSASQQAIREDHHLNEKAFVVRSPVDENGVKGRDQLHYRVCAQKLTQAWPSVFPRFATVLAIDDELDDAQGIPKPRFSLGMQPGNLWGRFWCLMRPQCHDPGFDCLVRAGSR